jgi:hypothetical protein
MLQLPLVSDDGLPNVTNGASIWHFKMLKMMGF